MMVVHQGNIVEFCAEPGEFVFDAGEEPTILYGKLGEGIKNTFAEFDQPLAFSGDAAYDLRTYYFNTTEFVSQFTIPTPVDVRVVDTSIGFDTYIPVRCNGEYSYRISDPLRLYKHVTGDVPDSFTRDKIDSQLKVEFHSAVYAGLERMSSLGIHYGSAADHSEEIIAAMREELSPDWDAIRGLSLSRVAFHVEPLPEDLAHIRDLERAAAMRDSDARAAEASGVEAKAAESMKAATGSGGSQKAVSWNCPSCGTLNKGRFCTECGTPRPEDWRCPVCGTSNGGKFCMECGTPRPEGWPCPACGTSNKGRFCIECGRPRP